MALPVHVENPNGKFRVISTKPMPGERWKKLLIDADCRLEICTSSKTILSIDDIISLIGKKCDGVIGQLTEKWGEELFSALARAGGKAYSNMAVGYDNVDVNIANKYNISVGNTPGVLTETTAELAASLTLSCARRVVEADDFMRAGKYQGWLPSMFVGNLLKGQTVGIIGAGRIGSAYARMMVEGFKMNVVYFDLYPATRLQKFVDYYGKFLESLGESAVTCTRMASPEEVLQVSDVVSLHPILDKTTYHLIDERRLNMMKSNAILINCSRGPVVDEVALVEHMKKNEMFRAGLDVFEDEPLMKPGLALLPNVVVVPHIASASEVIITITDIIIHIIGIIDIIHIIHIIGIIGIVDIVDIVDIIDIIGIVVITLTIIILIITIDNANTTLPSAAAAAAAALPFENIV